VYKEQYLHELKEAYQQRVFRAETLLNNIKSIDTQFTGVIQPQHDGSFSHYETGIEYLDSLLMEWDTYLYQLHAEVYKIIPQQVIDQKDVTEAHAYFLRYVYDNNGATTNYMGLTIHKIACTLKPNINPFDVYKQFWNFGELTAYPLAKLPDALTLFVIESNKIARDTRRGAGNVCLVSSHLWDDIIKYDNSSIITNDIHKFSVNSRFSSMQRGRFSFIVDSKMTSEKTALITYIGSKGNDCGATVVSCGDNRALCSDEYTPRYFRRIRFE
jgi:hypothetical protein